MGDYIRLHTIVEGSALLERHSHQVNFNTATDFYRAIVVQSHATVFSLWYPHILLIGY